MNPTLLLRRADVERLLTPDACIGAVEDAFRRHALRASQERSSLTFDFSGGNPP